jgi:hypothetical protein
MSAAPPRKKLPWPILVLTLFAGFLSTHSLWTFTGLDPSALEYGAFELRKGQTTLALRRHEAEPVFHKPGLDARGRISTPPGTVIALPFTGSTSYRISADDQIPYVVIGSAEAAPEAWDPSRLLVSPRALSIGRGGAPDLVPWDPDAPWQSDRARLSQLGATCGIAEGSGDLRITRRGEAMELELGRCSTTVPLPEETRVDERTTVALIAGPSWSFLERSDQPLRHRQIWSPPVMVALLLGLALVTLGLGRVMGAVLGLFLTAASPFQPAGAAVCLALTAVLALLVLLVRLLYLVLRAPLARRLTSAVACLCLMVVFLIPFQAAEPPLPARTLPDCVLAGYSMADGDSLNGKKGVYELLGEEPACERSARRYARSAETFHYIHDLICDEKLPFIPGDTVIFLGAANDDLMFSGSDDATVRRLSRLLFFGRDYFQKKPGMRSLLELIGSSSEQALSKRDRQRALLEETVACALEKKVWFYYVHDFLAPDIERGRSPARQELLRMRKDVIEQAASFVDLQAGSSGVVGVSWLADFLHLSEIGHRRVVEMLVPRLREMKAIRALRSRSPAPAAPGSTTRP